MQAGGKRDAFHAFSPNQRASISDAACRNLPEMETVNTKTKQTYAHLDAMGRS